MIRRTLLSASLAAALLLSAAPTVGASPVRPGEGPGFGAHVSEMAPEHPLACTRHFGECVSGMARGQCPHDN